MGIVGHIQTNAAHKRSLSLLQVDWQKGTVRVLALAVSPTTTTLHWLWSGQWMLTGRSASRSEAFGLASAGVHLYAFGDAPQARVALEP